MNWNLVCLFDFFIFLWILLSVIFLVFGCLWFLGTLPFFLSSLNPLSLSRRLETHVAGAFLNIGMLCALCILGNYCSPLGESANSVATVNLEREG